MHSKHHSSAVFEDKTHKDKTTRKEKLGKAMTLWKYRTFHDDDSLKLKEEFDTRI